MCGAPPNVPRVNRSTDTSWLPTVVPTAQSLVEHGERDTRHDAQNLGRSRGAGRVNADGLNPRFRLTPLGAGTYSLSLHDRNRWEPVPYEGTLDELVDVMNTDLAAWATPWPDVPS